MAEPSVQDAVEYLGFSESGWDPVDVESALAAETAAQAAVCVVPAAGAQWPADLLEALYRRVAHNLAVRRNPNGLEIAESEFGVTGLRVGGNDPEVNRLEAPHRSIAVA